MTGPRLEILDDTGRLDAGALQFLRVHGEAAIAKANGAGEVRVRVVGDDEMSRAHEEYMGVAGTTDVMTFDMSDPVEGEEPVVWCSKDELEAGYARPPFVLDTDLMVCLDEGERQAAARGYAVERELLLYIVHGVLHCLGYDDHDEEGFLAMHEMEDAVLAAIGVGATFGDRRTDR